MGQIVFFAEINKVFVAFMSVKVITPHGVFQVPVAFGPFTTKMDAFTWIEAIENAYCILRSAFALPIKGADALDENGMPIAAFSDFVVEGIPSIGEYDLKRGPVKHMFPVENAEVAVNKLPVYALEVAKGCVEYQYKLLTPKDQREENPEDRE